MPRRHINQAFASVRAADLLGGLLGDGREEVASWFERRYGGRAYLYGSARASLRALLVSAGIERGDEVILLGFTCIAVPEGVLYAGATPIYADLAPGSWTSGPDEIRAVASERTRVVIVQHTFGIPAPVDDIARLAEQHDWLVIEDCALALGSSTNGALLGTRGDAAIFSFEMTKTVTGGWGGVAVVRDPALEKTMDGIYASEPVRRGFRLAQDVVQLVVSTLLFKPAVFGLTKYPIAACYRLRIFRKSGKSLQPKVPSSWSYRMPRFLATVIAKQLRRLDRLVVYRQEIATRYRRWLDDSGRLDVSGDRSAEVVLLRFPLLVADPQSLVSTASREGYELGRWFSAPVAPMPEPPGKVGYLPGSCPRAERVAAQVVNLPLDPRMTESDVDRLIGLLERVDLCPEPLPG